MKQGPPEPERAIRAPSRTLSSGLDAPGEVWEEHRAWLAACLLAHKPPGSELDDLLQEVAVRIMQKLHTLEDPKRLRPWLRQVALNAARDAGRRGDVRRTENLPDLEAVAAERSELDVAIDRDEQRTNLARVLRLARQLPPDLAEPLLLRGVRGLSQREIAETLELTESSVESRLARARRKLADRFHRSAAEGPNSKDHAVALTGTTHRALNEHSTS